MAIGWIALLVFVVYSVIFVYKTKTGSPYIPSKDKQIKKMVTYIKKGDVVADMGAGDGRLLIAAIKAGAKEARGWEIEPVVWLRGWFNIRKLGLNDRVSLVLGDMWRGDLSKYDVVFVYQLERFSERFVEKCKKEMKPGSIVVANTYPLKGLPLHKRNKELFIYAL